jgi:hypothetical protein
MKIFGYLICKTNDNKAITAQAFRIGREIEKIINESSNNIIVDDIDLEARILTWYYDTKDEDFAKYMGIKKI